MRTHHRLSLIEHLQQVPDPRVKGRCEHELVDVLVIALCCLMCGGEGFNASGSYSRVDRLVTTFGERLLCWYVTGGILAQLDN